MCIIYQSWKSLNTFIVNAASSRVTVSDTPYLIAGECSTDITPLSEELRGRGRSIHYLQGSTDDTLKLINFLWARIKKYWADLWEDITAVEAEKYEASNNRYSLKLE